MHETRSLPSRAFGANPQIAGLRIDLRFVRVVSFADKDHFGSSREVYTRGGLNFRFWGVRAGIPAFRNFRKSGIGQRFIDIIPP